MKFLEEVGHDACGLNPDIGNFVRLHRPIEPVQDMLDKLLPHTNYWHVKNYLRDEDPATGPGDDLPGADGVRLDQLPGRDQPGRWTSASAAPSSASTTATTRSP